MAFVHLVALRHPWAEFLLCIRTSESGSHKELDVKRTRKAAGNQKTAQHDRSEVACLERLSGELEHPSRSRREGARAALRHLNRLVNLRAAADAISREEAWTQVFEENQPLVERAADPVGRVLHIARLSVEQIVQDIEISIVRREEEREIKREPGQSMRTDLFN